jgi:hypothetical protein
MQQCNVTFYGRLKKNKFVIKKILVWAILIAITTQTNIKSNDSSKTFVRWKEDTGAKEQVFLTDYLHLIETRQL